MPTIPLSLPRRGSTYEPEHLMTATKNAKHDRTEITYSPWRHGGWYTSVRHHSGACGCVSRNYPDKKWRIACDPRGFDANGRWTYASRREAALAEQVLVDAGAFCEGEECSKCQPVSDGHRDAWDALAAAHGELAEGRVNRASEIIAAAINEGRVPA